MYLKQFVRDESGCASYLIGSLRDGCAAVVDPQWTIEPYLQAAAAKGLRITQVLETHLHADHVSGARRLAEQTGAEIGIHAAAGVAFPHRALQDGDVVQLGEVALQVLHTPGHRPDNISLLVTDGERATEPCAVLTGDTLFVGGVGRPDLGGEAREYATLLYQSLFGKPLTPAAVHNLLRTGGEGGDRALVLDARDVAAYGAGHLPGAINVPLRAP